MWPCTPLIPGVSERRYTMYRGVPYFYYPCTAPAASLTLTRSWWNTGSNLRTSNCPKSRGFLSRGLLCFLSLCTSHSSSVCFWAFPLPGSCWEKNKLICYHKSKISSESELISGKPLTTKTTKAKVTLKKRERDEWKQNSSKKPPLLDNALLPTNNKNN